MEIIVNPATGSYFNIGVIITLGAIALACLVVLVLFKNKKGR